MTINSFPILIVEDSKDDFFLLNHALRKNGIQHPVYWVKDGVEAIDYLRGQGMYADRKVYPLPKILIVDLKMPRLGGLELLEWIKEQDDELSLLPVLVMSCSNQHQDISGAYNLGATTFFVKPSSFEDLQSLTKTIHDYWLKCVIPKLDEGSSGSQTPAIPIEG
jgi:CheY-like chemotaxis protein